MITIEQQLARKQIKHVQYIFGDLVIAEQIIKYYTSRLNGEHYYTGQNKT